MAAKIPETILQILVGSALLAIGGLFTMGLGLDEAKIKHTQQILTANKRADEIEKTQEEFSDYMEKMLENVVSKPVYEVDKLLMIERFKNRFKEKRE